MKKETGITMVSLVVTIIILIILAGIGIQVTIGEDGIITKVKQAKQNITLAGEAEAMQLNQLYYELETGSEMSEDEESTKKDEIIALLQKQVEELQKQVASLQTENAELKKQIQDLNTQIANLQTEIADLKAQIASKDIEIANLKKQVSEKEAKIQDLQNQLNNLNSLLAQTNATADKMLAGYKAYSGGKLLTGTMLNRGAISSTLNCGQTYTIPAGYHNGSGKVTANSLASQTSATANANNISNGVTAWVNGTKIIGNGADVNNSYNNGYNAGYEAGNKAGVQSITFTMNAYATSNVNYWQSQVIGFDITQFKTLTLGTLSGADAHNSSGVITVKADGNTLLNGVATGNQTLNITAYSKLDIILQGRYEKTMSLPITLSI
ncbi:MAG: hypothetical protein ACLU84_07330 [Clostridia bacterium]